ncbi:MAG: competence/damage-inducible protein A [Acidobacteriota bacterium]
MKNIPKIEILAVGTEFLSSTGRETDSLFICSRLEEFGLPVSFKSTVGDNQENLIRALSHAISRADILIITGGLGPTRDDLTIEACSYALRRKLFLRDDILQKIEQRFQKRLLKMPEVNKKQAFILEGAEVLENHQGTAPGQWLEYKGKIIVLLPGPPQELKPMFDSKVFPRLKKLFSTFSSFKLFRLTGISESQVEEIIQDLSIPENLNLTTLASPGQIEIRISSYSQNNCLESQKHIQQASQWLKTRLQHFIFTEEEENLEEVVGKLLTPNKKTVAVAESCTGGLLGHRLTNVPGSSTYFLGGVVAYSNETKIELLNLNPSLIESLGAVSSQVAEAMAIEIRVKFRASYGLSITGIAGPGGGTRQKPVGLVYTALADENKTEIVENRFNGQRESIKFQSSQKSLEMLWRRLKREKKL